MFRICNTYCFFHDSNGYVSMPQCYIICTVPLFFGIFLGISYLPHIIYQLITFYSNTKTHLHAAMVNSEHGNEMTQKDQMNARFEVSTVDVNDVGIFGCYAMLWVIYHILTCQRNTVPPPSSAGRCYENNQTLNICRCIWL
jgi:hypothetical protein